MNVLPCLSQILLILLLLPYRGQSQDASLQKEVDKLIQHEVVIDTDIVTGILVGVMDGEDFYYSTHGVALSPDSIYELGSVTKPIAYWLATIALDSLGLDVDTPICQILPDSLCGDVMRRLTIRQVLEHQAGLPMWPGGIGLYAIDNDDPYRFYSADHLSTAIRDVELTPGTYAYSHTGYALLHWLFESVGGISDFSKAQFEQLEMYHTGWLVDDALVAQGHGKDGKIAPPWHSDVLAPAIGLKSGLYDLLSFIRLRSPELSYPYAIPDKSLRRKITAMAKRDEYLLNEGWFLVPDHRYLIYYHNGHTGGHHVSIAFIPDQQKGVVVISNASPGSGELSLLILGMITR